ncbi:hypothetical protein FQR65_LT03307 [Abscondita terminalis]|nr:hypothetical protein FQR65_LT03307 [Abscondita terminalis]
MLQDKSPQKPHNVHNLANSPSRFNRKYVALSLNVSYPSLENQPKLLHPQLQNITLRSRQRNNESESLQEKSAIKIQAAFRGHRQRKFYEEMKMRKKQTPLEVPNLPEKVLTQNTNHHVPPIMPYPYNFINAVKRKLNLVTRQTLKVDTVDVAIQSSLADDLKTPKLDLKSFLSHKCLDFETMTIFNKKSSSKHTVNVENGCVSESDTSKDIPELSSENTISESLRRSSVQCAKRSHSTDTDPTLTINVEGVKKLKLRQPKLVESEVSEHLSEPKERISSSRDSIIASNKCNYITNSVVVEKSVSIVSNEPVLSNQMTYMKEKQDTNRYNFDNKENISQVNTAQDKSKSSNAYSSNFTNVTTDIPKLETPKVSLKTSLPISTSEDSDTESVKKLITNVILKTGEKSTLETKAKTNEIHLKFEAELHLLNDFNDSLRRVMAVEKSLLELHEKKHEATLNYENRDTQTSIDQQNQIANINYSRGSDVTNGFSINQDLNFVTTSLDLSPFNSPIEESNSEDIGDKKLKFPNVLGGISLEMFEQLIKDEDARIENLKAILKIREKSLVDRTKGELAWLEVQKKNLRDAGQLQEISAIKKKQRGLLIKLEHERHEMQRLKQMQKAASKERKTVLREQRNMIKAQLAAGNTVTRIKRNTREQKRQSGPFKVYNIQSNNDSIVSETSVTRKSSITEEVVSATSNRSHSIVSHISEELIFSEKIQLQGPKDTSVRAENVKRSLLMREAALQKRKKVAEELLQWHQRLLEEERKITELELAASAIINQVPISKEESMSAKQSFKGSQLNQLWLSLTGRSEKKFKDEEIYNMSQASLEKFCRNAKKYERVASSQKRSRIPDAKKSAKTKTTIPIEDVSKGEINDYVSDFESVVTSASFVSEHTQSSSDSTLSNHEVTTVTEITKPSVNKNAKHDQTADDSTIITTNSGEVRCEGVQKSASESRYVSSVNETKISSELGSENDQKSTSESRPVSVNDSEISSEVVRESDKKSASESRSVSVNDTKTSSEVGSESDQKSASESRRVSSANETKISSELGSENDQKSTSESRPVSVNDTEISSEVVRESDKKSASESRSVSVNDTKTSSEVGSERDKKSASESRLVSVNETKISSKVVSESDQKSANESIQVSVNETKISNDVHNQITSKTIVDEILNEIDKYLDSQSNSLGDSTLASKSISKDTTQSKINKDSVQISTSICDNTQVIDEVSDINETDVKSSTVSDDEVEELWKKQLEIEQEQIKAIQQLQQKEQLPYLYVREIPNKPPPPYTPPIKAQSSPKGSVLPSGDSEINIITTAAAQILHKAAATNTIKDIVLKENSKKYLELKSNVEGQCYEFIFDLSKEFALDHYKQFEPDTGPSWMHLQKKSKLAIGRPFDQTGLQKFISKKVKQVLGHEVVVSKENLKHKWSGKKRDHVDELLVVECQAEEAEWTNYDRDELIVKDELTKEIMNMLLSETGQVLNNILSKKKYLC